MSNQDVPTLRRGNTRSFPVAMYGLLTSAGTPPELKPLLEGRVARRASASVGELVVDGECEPVVADREGGLGRAGRSIVWAEGRRVSSRAKWASIAEAMEVRPRGHLHTALATRKARPGLCSDSARCKPRAIASPLRPLPHLPELCTSAKVLTCTPKGRDRQVYVQPDARRPPGS